MCCNLWKFNFTRYYQTLASRAILNASYISHLILYNPHLNKIRSHKNSLTYYSDSCISIFVKYFKVLISSFVNFINKIDLVKPFCLKVFVYYWDFERDLDTHMHDLTSFNGFILPEILLYKSMESANRKSYFLNPVKIFHSVKSVESLVIESFQMPDLLLSISYISKFIWS